MKNIALLSVLFVWCFAGAAYADGVMVKELTIENIDQLSPELRKAICERETKVVEKKVEAKKVAIKKLEKKAKAKTGTVKRDEQKKDAEKIEKEHADLSELQRQIAVLKDRIDKLDGSVSKADLDKLQQNIDAQVSAVAELKAMVEELRHESKPVGIGISLGFMAWKSLSGLSYGAPTLELRYTWTAANATEVYLAVEAGVWPTDKNPFSFLGKTGVTFAIHPNLGLRVGADMGAFSLDNQLKARCYLITGEVGPVWKPLSWLEVEASGLAGSVFTSGDRPSFTYGGQGAVRVKF